MCPRGLAEPPESPNTWLRRRRRGPAAGGLAGTIRSRPAPTARTGDTCPPSGPPARARCGRRGRGGARHRHQPFCVPRPLPGEGAVGQAWPRSLPGRGARRPPPPAPCPGPRPRPRPRPTPTGETTGGRGAPLDPPPLHWGGPGALPLSVVLPPPPPTLPPVLSPAYPPPPPRAALGAGAQRPLTSALSPLSLPLWLRAPTPRKPVPRGSPCLRLTSLCPGMTLAAPGAVPARAGRSHGPGSPLQPPPRVPRPADPRCRRRRSRLMSGRGSLPPCPLPGLRCRRGRPGPLRAHILHGEWAESRSSDKSTER